MDDGKTDYFTRMDMVKFAAEHTGGSSVLRLVLWPPGRICHLAGADRHGQGVDSGPARFRVRVERRRSQFGQPADGANRQVLSSREVRPERSYPAFSNSSIDQKLGNGDPKDGDLEGGINLGFLWKES